MSGEPHTTAGGGLFVNKKISIWRTRQRWLSPCGKSGLGGSREINVADPQVK
jgi:hypothetical protein